MKFDPEHQRST